MSKNESRRELDAGAMEVRERYGWLVQSIGPRPIALVTTMSESGVVNLAPYSFFNGFGANPAVVAFSPTNRSKDGSTKDTLRNLLVTKQFTISVVTWSMTEQMNIAAGEYSEEVDEFVRSGFTKLPSIKVKPPAVAESPLVMEGKLLKHIELGAKNASGNLLLGEIEMYRVCENVLDGNGKVDPRKLDQVGRLGANWYTRAKVGLFELPKPTGLPLGFEALPKAVKHSSVLTGSELAQLASVTQRPDTAQWLDELRAKYGQLPERKVHEQIQLFIATGKLVQAWALAEILSK